MGQPLLGISDQQSTLAEGASARTWRKHKMRLTRKALGMLISYHHNTIWEFEFGLKHYPEAWLRYRRACERVHRRKFPEDANAFNWGHQE